MDAIVEEIITAYTGPYANPGLLLAAASTIVVLLTGLGARIVELVQAARWARRGAPDVTLRGVEFAATPPALACARRQRSPKPWGNGQRLCHTRLSLPRGVPGDGGCQTPLRTASVIRDRSPDGNLAILSLRSEPP